MLHSPPLATASSASSTFSAPPNTTSQHNTTTSPLDSTSTADDLSPKLHTLHVSTSPRPIATPKPGRTPTSTATPPSVEQQLHREQQQQHEAEIFAAFVDIQRSLQAMATFLEDDNNRPKAVPKERWTQLRTSIHRSRNLASPGSARASPLRTKRNISTTATYGAETEAPPPSSSKRAKASHISQDQSGMPLFATPAPPPPVFTPTPSAQSRKRFTSPSPTPESRSKKTVFWTPNGVQTRPVTEVPPSGNVEEQTGFNDGSDGNMMDAEHIPAPTRPMRKPVSVVGRRKAAKAGRRMEEEEEVTMSAGIGKRRRHGRGELSERAQVVGVKRGRDEDDEAKDGKEGQNNSEEEEERVEGRELRKRGRLGYRQDGDPEVEYYEPGELDSDTESEESDDEVEVYWTIVSDEPVKQQEAPAPTNAAPRKRTDGEEEDEDYERERGNRKRVKRSRKSMA